MPLTLAVYIVGERCENLEMQLATCKRRISSLQQAKHISAKLQTVSSREASTHPQRVSSLIPMQSSNQEHALPAKLLREIYDRHHLEQAARNREIKLAKETLAQMQKLHELTVQDLDRKVRHLERSFPPSLNKSSSFKERECEPI